MKKESEALRIETESKRSCLSEIEKKLELALKEAEAAKAAEAQAIEEIKNLSARANAARSSTSVKSGATIKITFSKDDYESLSCKVEGSEKLTEMIMAAAVVQVETIRASEAELAKRLIVIKKEIEEMEKAREEALKRVEMAEVAKKVEEGELRRWHKKEQKRASKMATRLMSETEAGAILMEASPPRVLKASVAIPTAQGSEGAKKLMKKSSLLPNLSGIFHRKKSTVDGGSPSPVPGEKEKHA